MYIYIYEYMYITYIHMIYLIDIYDIYTDDAFNRVTRFGKDIGKTTVSAQDTPGFIVNRLLVPYLMQAMSMVDRADATVADIDVSMQLGAGHPMGPLHLADYIGKSLNARSCNVKSIY
jgi:3-hydroxyacyl-CoA dehydrogenase